MRRGMAGLVLFLVGGCAAGPPVTGPEEAISHWRGRPVAEAISAWGEPAEIWEQESGTTYIWVASHYPGRYFPANLPPRDHYLPYAGTIDDLRCRGVLLADQDGIVRAADWQGYECRFLP